MSEQSPLKSPLAQPITILVCQLLILAVQILIYVPPFSARLVRVDCTDCDLDAIHVAAQLGRLDVVSLFLAMLGIILVVIGFWGFFSVKAQANRIAKITATEVATEVAASIVDKMFSATKQKADAGGLRTAEVIETLDSERMKDDTNDR